MKNWAFQLTILFIVSCQPAGSVDLDSVDSSRATLDYGIKVTEDMREDALRRAKVWMEPQIPVESFDFLEGVPGSDAFKSTDEISCRWVFEELPGGYTPKFRCMTQDGDTFKVKYASGSKNNNSEIPAEIAATRLLTALGFGADRMYSAKTIRCWGCPDDPWSYLLQIHNSHRDVRDRFFWVFGKRDQNDNYFYAPNFRKFTDFTFTSVERRFGENSISSDEKKGWEWKEIQKVSVAHGGSSRAEVDAFLLMAVFLQHTDSKADSQRLVCLNSVEPDGYCSEPMLIMQDVGATFGGPFKIFPPGHDKFDLDGWQEAPVWKDHSQCIVDIKDSPVGTFEEAQISEEGRLFLGSLLSKLSDRQIHELFKGARAHEYGGSSEHGIEAWVGVFKEKRSLVVDRNPCPR